MRETEVSNNVFFDENSFGVVAMAVYQPNYELFLAQLLSIKNQTHTLFKCMISVDGDPGPIISFVKDKLNDPRFEVLGFENRLGFYRNFERVLASVSADAQWIALSDQDDYWYAEKLRKLIPHLNEHDLVSGQAQVIQASTGQIISVSTNRKNVPLVDLIAQNQVTGGQAIFRRQLLDVALPFPQMETSTQVHDHWLAVCASAVGSFFVVDDLVQNYVQHGGNVLGEVAGGFDPMRSVRRVRAIANKFEGGQTAAHVLRACRNLSYGWREAMVDALYERAGDSSPEFSTARKAFSSVKKWRHTVRALVGGVRRGNIALSCFAEFVAGAPGELIKSRVAK